MTKRHSARSVSRQHLELAFAAPQVIAHRTSRMLAAGARPGARDSAEFTRMFTEKTGAFSQAWFAGWVAACTAPWTMGMALLRMGAFAAGPKAGDRALRRAWDQQGWHVAGSWLAPVHRTAVANARRLALQR